ncbi:MAG: c-type cytochrome domain-containing protein [Maioricimonas sp. JB045]
MSRTIGFACVLVLLVRTTEAQETVRPDQLAEQGYGLLKKYCARCHGDTFAVTGLDVYDRSGLVEAGYIEAGDPEKSQIWQRVGVDRDMPPEDQPQPSAEEIAVLKEWIRAGAEFPALDTRSPVTLVGMYQAMNDHLQSAPAEDRPFLRFYTFANLNNHPAGVTNDEFRLYQAALSKAINGLSWQSRIVRPVAVDQQQTLFVIDLRDYGWEDGLWTEILRQYPYGLRHDQSSDDRLRSLAKRVLEMTGTSIPCLRGDWFVAHATRPPLYHTLLQLPETAAALEEKLSVDVVADFRNDRLQRAGFATSGVSNQNRLVDRHRSVHGIYWKSYDFKSNVGRGNLFQFPLGPEFENGEFSKHAFAHDGGEIIFSLPNGLHGYLLVDSKGNRIDEGPVDVVSNSLKTGGTPIIINGMSCMACHKHGVITFRDTLREGAGVFGTARDKLRRLTPLQSEMDGLLDQDREQFVAALGEAVGKFLQVGDDRDRDLQSFPEPISAVVTRYQADLGPQTVAAELWLDDSAELERIVETNSRLKTLGLGPLAGGATIKRQSWDALSGGVSTFQLGASALDIGIPHRVFGGSTE